MHKRDDITLVYSWNYMNTSSALCQGSLNLVRLLSPAVKTTIAGIERLWKLSVLKGHCWHWGASKEGLNSNDCICPETMDHNILYCSVPQPLRPRKSNTVICLVTCFYLLFNLSSPISSFWIFLYQLYLKKDLWMSVIMLKERLDPLSESMIISEVMILILFCLFWLIPPNECSCRACYVIC